MLEVSTLARQQMEFDETTTNKLKRHTQIRPLKPGRELQRIAFSRSREIEIEWDEIIGENDAAGKIYSKGIGIEYIRRELEKSWGYPEGVPNNTELAYINERFVYSLDPPAVYFQTLDSSRIFTAAVEKNDDYTVPMDRPAFQNLAAYNSFWENVSFVLSNYSGEKSELEMVDLAPAIIYRHYRELKALQKLGDSLAVGAEKIATKEFADFPSASELSELVDGFQRMRFVKTDIDLKLETLRDRAKDLGYYLALASETIRLPDGTQEQIQEGQLYQPYLATVSWRTLHYRRALIRTRSLFGFGSSSWQIQIPYYNQHVANVTRYSKIIPDLDPWVEKERELSAAGFSVYRFEKNGSRYITTQGESIEDIIQRCELDEAFQRRCAVLIPLYEQSLIKGDILAKYLAIKRPRKGVQFIHLPRLFIEEELLFSTHFKRVELGELMETINLAPGEEREIVVERSTLTETEERRTATSISDLTVSEKIDLSTEMEKEVTSSREQTTSKSLSAKAGGSYGPFSGSAEGSTSSTLTTRQFSRDLQRVANKASQSVTKQTRQEVKTDSSSKSNVSTRQSTKILIKNINDGRSLNLLFYQLYNIFRLSLRLEKMTFTLLSGREIIAGSGIVLPETYSMDRLGAAIERMTLDGAPVTPNYTRFPNNSDYDARESYIKQIVSEIKDTLKNEYVNGGPEGSETVEIATGDWDPADPNASARVYVETLVSALRKVRYLGTAIQPPGLPPAQGGSVDDTLVVGSPGLYLDSFVGARPGTEPYSEEMRTVELAKRHAEVEEIQARAAYYEAVSRRLARPDPGNTVTGMARDLKTLVLTFVSEPLQGQWKLYISEAHVVDFTIPDTQLVQTVPFVTDQAWLQQTTVEVARIVHVATKQELVFLI